MNINKLNKFLSTANFLKVFIFGYLLSFLIGFLIFIPLEYIIGDGVLDTIIILKTILTLSIPMGLIVTFLISESNKSDKFWIEAEKVNKLITLANSIEELNNILNIDLKNLNKLSRGEAHKIEINRLFTIIDTRKKYHKN